MTSRERILATIEGRPADRTPLTTWCFGLPAPPELRWRREGREITHWYSMRMEHLHALPQAWTVADDFRRVETWLRLGVDDLLDVSVPWSVDPQVTWRDEVLPAGQADRYPVLVREYQTPAGPVRHAVRSTGEETGAGWVTQPATVQLLEDYNIPRAVEHVVSRPSDVAAVRLLYGPPDASASRKLAERLDEVGRFAAKAGVAVQAWSAFGMDAVVWLAGTEGAVFLAMDEPEAFGRLIDEVAATDLARTAAACRHPAVDIVVERGWYSSTDFWSPALFDRYVVPHVAELVRLAHRYGKKFAYVMTTGVEALGPRLADAGVDVLYFVDPVQDGIDLARARELLGGRMTLVGGTNALSLASGDPARIRGEVRSAVEILGPTRRFILHPVDAVFPDTPWSGVQALIEAWRECGRGHAE